MSDDANIEDGPSVRSARRIDRLYGQAAAWGMDELFDDDSSAFHEERLTNPDFARFAALRQSRIAAGYDSYGEDMVAVVAAIVLEEMTGGR